MTGRIISLHGDLHDDACALLPWYVTGRLDAEDAARVEAHLPVCAQCQADLAAERRLQTLMAGLEEPAADADAGFEALRGRLAPRRPKRFAGIGRQWRDSAPWLRWAVAAELLLLVLGAGALAAMHTAKVSPLPPKAVEYRTLGAAPEPSSANIVVVFRPDIRESELRQTLRDSHARLVGGPTAADAYLLHVDAAGRAAAVARLRRQDTIVLAEPIDAGDKP
jgi:anti-sigma factor RsiW